MSKNAYVKAYPLEFRDKVSGDDTNRVSRRNSWVPSVWSGVSSPGSFPGVDGTAIPARRV